MENTRPVCLTSDMFRCKGAGVLHNNITTCLPPTCPGTWLHLSRESVDLSSVHGWHCCLIYSYGCLKQVYVTNNTDLIRECVVDETASWQLLTTMPMNGATHKGYSNLHTSSYSSFLYRGVRRIYEREREMREGQSWHQFVVSERENWTIC